MTYATTTCQQGIYYQGSFYPVTFDPNYNNGWRIQTSSTTLNSYLESQAPASASWFGQMFSSQCYTVSTEPTSGGGGGSPTMGTTTVQGAISVDTPLLTIGIGLGLFIAVIALLVFYFKRKIG